MSVWTALVVIVIVVALVRLRIENNRIEALRTDSGERDSLQSEIVDLQERIAVLERIVTDERRSRGIAEDIEALRDEPVRDR